MRIKICGLTLQKDAAFAIELGADAVGFIHEGTSPRFVGPENYPWIERLDPWVPKVAVFGKVNQTVPQGIFDLVQGVEWEEYPMPAAKRIHVLRLRAGQKADDLIQQTVNASAIMLDAYKDGAYGGTGHTVDWGVAAEIVARSERPVILAGGLTPENVAEAVRRVRPFAVDVASGIEKEPGVKDPYKMAAFIDAARSA